MLLVCYLGCLFLWLGGAGMFGCGCLFGLLLLLCQASMLSFDLTLVVGLVVGFGRLCLSGVVGLIVVFSV